MSRINFFRPVSREALGFVALALIACQSPKATSCVPFNDRVPRPYGYEDYAFDCGLDRPEIGGTLNIHINPGELVAGPEMVRLITQPPMTIRKRLTMFYILSPTKLEPSGIQLVVDFVIGDPDGRNKDEWTSEKENVAINSPHDIFVSWKDTHFRTLTLDGLELERTKP